MSSILRIDLIIGRNSSKLYCFSPVEQTIIVVMPLACWVFLLLFIIYCKTLLFGSIGGENKTRQNMRPRYAVSNSVTQ